MLPAMAGTYFDLQITRVRLAARLAIARGGMAVSHELIDATRRELADVETMLSHMRFEPGRRDAQLSASMNLTENQLDFVWGVVARAVDPLLLPLLQPLCGTEVRRGLSIAHYATIMGLDVERSAELADLVLPGHMMRRHK